MIDILVFTGGHPFDRASFYALFDGLAGVRATHVEHPAAEHCLAPSFVARFAAIVFYDMPGIRFTGGDGVRFVPPGKSVPDNMRALGDAGVGLVFLHHAIAGWPSWPAYAEIFGARFLYAPDRIDGIPYPDSGYRHDVTHTIVTEPGAHPVTRGLPDSFEMTDELYLMAPPAKDMVPLFRSRHEFVAKNFYSSSRAVHGRLRDNAGWSHPPGSPLIGWARSWRASPVVYLQPGDGASAFDDTNYRRMVANAIDWVTSSSANEWASRRG